MTAPTALLGDWSLSRIVSDEVAGMSGTVRGLLALREDQGRIRWTERGTLRWGDSRVPVHRSYEIRRREDGWWVHFADGRPFHPWRTGVPIDHACGEDRYRGTITITGPDRWNILWIVRGPRKTQRIATWLTRPVIP